MSVAGRFKNSVYFNDLKPASRRAHTPVRECHRGSHTHFAPCCSREGRSGEIFLSNSPDVAALFGHSDLVKPARELVQSRAHFLALQRMAVTS